MQIAKRRENEGGRKKKMMSDVRVVRTKRTLASHSRLLFYLTCSSHSLTGATLWDPHAHVGTCVKHAPFHWLELRVVIHVYVSCVRIVLTFINPNPIRIINLSTFANPNTTNLLFVLGMSIRI